MKIKGHIGTLLLVIGLSGCAYDPNFEYALVYGLNNMNAEIHRQNAVDEYQRAIDNRERAMIDYQAEQQAKQLERALDNVLSHDRMMKSKLK